MDKQFQFYQSSDIMKTGAVECTCIVWSSDTKVIMLWKATTGAEKGQSNPLLLKIASEIFIIPAQMPKGCILEVILYEDLKYNDVCSKRLNRIKANADTSNQIHA